MASAVPKSEGIQTPYANIGLGRENRALLQELLDFRRRREREEGWEEGEHNCAVIAVHYQSSPDSAVETKLFFADSSNGNNEDTNTHAERRAWVKAKAWVEQQITTNRIVVGGVTVVSELKACSTNKDDCRTFFAKDGDATIGDPTTTLVFNSNRDKFYYTNEGPEQLALELSTLREKESKKTVEKATTAKDVGLAKAKHGAKALNVTIDNILKETPAGNTIREMLMSEKSGRYELFIETLSQHLRAGKPIGYAMKHAVHNFTQQGGLAFNGKPGATRANQLGSLLEANMEAIQGAIAQEKQPAWGAGPRYGGLEGTYADPPPGGWEIPDPTHVKSEGTYAAAPPSGWSTSSPMMMSSRGKSASTGSLTGLPPPHVKGTQYNMDDILKRLAFLSLTSEQQEKFKVFIANEILKVDEWNKRNKNGEPLSISSAAEKFFYHHAHLSSQQTTQMIEALKGITSDNIIRSEKPNTNSRLDFS